MSPRKVLLDECVDRGLVDEITGHEVRDGSHPMMIRSSFSASGTLSILLGEMRKTNACLLILILSLKPTGGGPSIRWFGPAFL